MRKDPVSYSVRQPSSYNALANVINIVQVATMLNLALIGTVWKCSSAL